MLLFLLANKSQLLTFFLPRRTRKVEAPMGRPCTQSRGCCLDKVEVKKFIAAFIMADRGDQALKTDSTPSLWPEDTVEYRIYCPVGDKDEDEVLSRLAVECNHASRALSSSHMWHYGAFTLKPMPAVAGEKILFIEV